MGLMIQPTPEYGAEVRKESFYITTMKPNEHPIYVYGGAPVRADGVAEFLLADIPKLRQVLDAVEAEVDNAKKMPGNISTGGTIRFERAQKHRQLDNSVVCSVKFTLPNSEERKTTDTRLIIGKDGIYLDTYNEALVDSLPMSDFEVILKPVKKGS